MKDLLAHPYLYNADQDLEDYIISKFYEKHESLKNLKLNIGFYDIENEFYENGLDKPGYEEFPEPEKAPIPINVISLDFPKENTMYCLIWRNPNNKQLMEIIKDIPQLERDIENFIKNYNKKFNLSLKSKVLLFDNEYDLICKFFDLVHEHDADYMLAWNDSYDIQTILNRLRKRIKKKYRRISDKDLETEVSRIACDPKYYHQVSANGKEVDLLPRVNFIASKAKIGRKFPYLSILDGTCWIDQMSLYAALRTSKKDSYSLDNIARDEVDFHKYPHKSGTTIRNESMLDAKSFLFYNTNDVSLLELINDKCKDVEEYQQLSEITQTRKDKVLSKSVALINYLKVYGRTKNMVMSVNKNSVFNKSTPDIDEDDSRYLDAILHKDKFGAIVSNPDLNDNIGKEVNGKPSKYVFEVVGDLDYSSLYPSCIEALSIDPDGMVGKFYLIDDDVKKLLKEKYGCEHSFELSAKDDADDENISLSSSGIKETNDLGSMLSSFIVSQNWSAIGKVFMDLPDTDEILDDIGEYIKNKK